MVLELDCDEREVRSLAKTDDLCSSFRNRPSQLKIQVQNIALYPFSLSRSPRLHLHLTIVHGQIVVG